MSLINSYFDKIYCINLDSEKSRALDSLSRFRAFGITPHWISAIPGSLVKDLYHSHQNQNQTPITNPNYVACALSHMMAMKHAVSNGYERILILEDDLLFHKDLHLIFDSLITTNKIPSSWDMLYLGWIPLSDDLTMWDYNVINGNFINDKVFKAKNLWSGMAYGISKSAMEYVLASYSISFSMEIDRFYVNHVQTMFDCYGVSPQLFAGQDNYSTNAERFEDSIFLRSHDTRSSTDKDYV